MTLTAIKLLLLSLSITSNVSSHKLVTTSSSITDIDDGILYICENLLEFQDNYNSSFPSEPQMHATEVENMIPLTIIDEDDQFEGILIDLNDDCGYITIGYDYQIYDIVADGEQPFIEYPNKEYSFTTTNGYFYFDEDINDYLSINEENNSAEEDWTEILLNRRTYLGHESGASGNGKIENIDDFVEDKYGSEYTLYQANSLQMNGYNQSELSVYRTYDKNNSKITEGNCWIVSAYNVLQYLSEKYFSDMYSNDYVVYNAKLEEPNIFSKHFDENEVSLETVRLDNGESIPKWDLTYNMLPKLYAEIRRFVDTTYGKCDGGTSWETSNIVKQIASNYNHTINDIRHYMWGRYAYNVINYIDSNVPCIWSTSNDTYGAHSMAICGYRTYRKEIPFLCFKIINKKLFYELKDGHERESRFFDVSAHIGFSCLTFFELS